MPTAKNNRTTTKKIESLNPVIKAPIDDPENIIYYTSILENTRKVIQEALYDSSEISKAVRKATCKEYMDFREAIHTCLHYIERINDTILEDFFIDG